MSDMKNKADTSIRVCNFGSINVDHVYAVDHFVRPGETLNSTSYRMFAGGKGYNQSVALARSGVRVWHAGRIGDDHAWLIDHMQHCGVDTSGIKRSQTPTGHAVIQVVPSGENAIFLNGGANLEITPAAAEEVITRFSPGDYLLIQNEISSISEIIALGHSRNMTVVFNPAPMDETVLSYPLDLVDIFIVNAIEGEQLSQQKKPQDIIACMKNMFPRAATVLTLGENGAIYADSRQFIREAAYRVSPVDTTAAGDTFIGFFLGSLMQGKPFRNALARASKAAALCITRPGAADSIPSLEEVKTACLEK